MCGLTQSIVIMYASLDWHLEFIAKKRKMIEQNMQWINTYKLVGEYKKLVSFRLQFIREK